eukprot:16622_1
MKDQREDQVLTSDAQHIEPTDKDDDRVKTVENDENDKTQVSDKWYSLRIGTDPLFSLPSTFFTDVDGTHRILIFVYFGLAIVSYAIIHQHYQNRNGLYFCEAFETISASFVMYDLILFALCITIFIAVDFWRKGFSIYTAILFLTHGWGVGAVAITVPIYLAMRVSRECKIKAANTQSKRNSCSWTSFIPFLIYEAIHIYFYLGPTPFNHPKLNSNCDQ